MRRATRGLIAALAVCAALVVVPASALALQPLGFFGFPGQAAGQLGSLGGIAVGPDGAIYAADAENNRVDVFTPDGILTRAFGRGVDPAGGDVCTAASGCRKGIAASDAGALNGPRGIALDPAGLVYVSDSGNHRIDVFTPAGAFIRAFGKGVALSGPNADVCTAASGCKFGGSATAAGSISDPRGLSFGAGGLLFIASRQNNRIDVFTPAGAFVRAFGRGINATDGSGVCTAASGCPSGPINDHAAGGMLLPTDVESGPGGLLAVADSANFRVDVFTPEGAFVRSFGADVNPQPGSPPDVCVSTCQAGKEVDRAGGLADPEALAFSAAGTVLVADRFNHRVSEFALDGSFIRAFGSGVADGAAAFEVCSALTGCARGLANAQGEAGAMSTAESIAVDCRGAVFVREADDGFARIERFGEDGTPPGPCPPPVPPPPGAQPSGSLSFGRLQLNRRKGTATLQVRVPGPGKLDLGGAGLRPVHRTAKQAGTVALPVGLRGKARAALLRTGKRAVRVRLTFTPLAGVATTQPKTLVLKKTTKRHPARGGKR